MNYKKIFSALAVLGSVMMPLGAWAAEVEAVDEEAAKAPVISKRGVYYSESVLPYDGGLLISNFGIKDVDKHLGAKYGNITYVKGNKVSGTVKSGILNKPTGMAVKDGYLYVCDVNKLMLFDLEDSKRPLKKIGVPSKDKIVNDVALDGDYLYITTTNPGAIYRLEVTEAAKPKKLEKFVELAGANGITAHEGVLYVATIPPDYKTVAAEHVVYKITDLASAKPQVERFRDVPGLYDGAALNEDGTKLYISDWSTGSVTEIDVETKAERVVYEEIGIGPADIAVAEGNVYIPDLLNSRVITIPNAYDYVAPVEEELEEGTEDAAAEPVKE